MSYDLFLSAGPGKKLSKKTFSDYFGQRARYNVGDGQAIYQNEDTGVYFIFDEPEDGIVAFNLNYLRPHVFGLEAALELEQFSEAFAATVGDPQGFMEEGAGFQTELFLQGWNEGNQMAYGPMLKEQSEPIYCWPSQRIRGESCARSNSRPAHCPDAYRGPGALLHWHSGRTRGGIRVGQGTSFHDSAGIHGRDALPQADDH